MDDICLNMRTYIEFEVVSIYKTRLIICRKSIGNSWCNVISKNLVS